MFNYNNNSHSNTQYTTTSSSTEYTTPIQNTQQPTPIQNTQLQYTIHNTHQPAPVQNTQLQYTIHNNQLQYTIHNSQNSNSHIKFVPLNQFSPQQLFLHQICTQSHSTHVILQFNWLCDVCGCVMSPTSGIYWVDLGFINNYKELQLWLVLLRYSADVASAFPWVVTYGIRTGSVIPCELRDTTPQSGP